MIKISEKHLRTLAAADDVETVRGALAEAVRFELATIPVYLTALFSIKQAGNREAGALVQAVVAEEMLHLTLVCNALIAIGGTPRIAAAGASLRFPGPLPMAIDNGLNIKLAALTIEQVCDVFMAIEKPDSPFILPGEQHPNPPPRVPGEYGSIGDFYQAVIAALGRLQRHGADCFATPRLQHQVDVAKWFAPTGSSYPDGKVFDLASATAAIGTIVTQGEGTCSGEHDSPYDDAGRYAHYFMFGEIYHGQRLISDAAAPSGWSYSGDKVPLDPSMVHALLENAALSDYVAGSGPHVAGEQFHATYRRLLGALDTVFNGQPETLRAAMGIMYELKLVAQKVMQFELDPGNGQPPVIAAPPFMLTRAPVAGTAP